MNYDGISAYGSNIIYTINVVFLLLLNVEIGLKLLVFKELYFKNVWNKFDLAIIIYTNITYFVGIK